VICPKCGEDNSDNFRFCGMCGTLLEARRPAGAPAPGLPKIANAPEPLRTPLVENATRPANKQRPIGGPSVLGLNRPGSNQPPSMDSPREKSFSGLDSFFEAEQPKTGGRRILLLVALLAALGGAGWWTYTNYLGAAESRKPGAATSSAAEAPAEKPSTKAVAKDAAPALDAGSSPAAAPSAGVPEGPSENASAAPDTTSKTAESEAKPAVPATKERSLTPAPATTPKIPPAEKRPPKRASIVASAKASKMSAPEPADTGDAAFRKGEAYLYGRGVPKNCDEAVKNLKAASARSNAKARSAFGTMYATGHCVPRDLPTSYLWFALALRVDPNNQILEKDLSAVWNQMTPPERQMATRMKQ